jgi:hypothetical protein
MALLTVHTDGSAENTFATLDGLALDDVAYIKIVVRRRDGSGLSTAHEVEFGYPELGLGQERRKQREAHLARQAAIEANPCPACGGKCHVPAPTPEAPQRIGQCEACDGSGVNQAP